jgi:hypothetical protein
MALIKAAAFAAQMGISPQAVRKAIAEGRLVNSVQREGRSWMINDETAEAEWNRNTSPSLQRGKIAQRRQQQEMASSTSEESLPAGGGAISQAKAMAIRTGYQAKLLALEYEERSGKLVNVEEMRRQRFESGRQVRDAVLRIGPQMFGEIAKAAGGMSPDERAEVLLVIQRYLVNALEALADGAGQG